MSTENLKELQALDGRHYLHPFSDHKQIREHGTRVIARGEGVYIYDTEGRQILDGMSGLWCVSLGYGRRELIEAAHRQLQTLPYYNSFFQCTTRPAIELATLLSELAPPALATSASIFRRPTRNGRAPTAASSCLTRPNWSGRPGEL